MTTEYVKYARELKKVVPKGFSAVVCTQATDVEGEVNSLMTYGCRAIKINEAEVCKVNQGVVKASPEQEAGKLVILFDGRSDPGRERLFSGSDCFNGMDIVRNVDSRNVKAIMDIYGEYVVNNATMFEAEPLWMEEMKGRIAETSASYPYLVCVDHDEAVGYYYAHAWKEKTAYKYMLETTVYLSPGYKGGGIDRQLMEELIEECRAGGHRALTACITEGNKAGCLLHKKLGFRKVSHFKKVGLRFGR